MQTTMTADKTQFEKQIQIPIKELRAARLFASTHKSRYSLNGVRVEAKADKVLLIATDGRSMVLVDATLQLPWEKSVSATIPSEAIDAIAKGCSKDSTVTIELVGELAILTAGAKDNCVIVKARTLGAYPDWSRVLPTSDRDAIEFFGIDGLLMERLSKAASLLGVDAHLIISLRRDGVFEVRIHRAANFYGLIMPMKVEAGASIPAWVSSSGSPPGLEIPYDSVELFAPVGDDYGKLQVARVASSTTPGSNPDGGDGAGAPHCYWSAICHLRIGSWELHEVFEESYVGKARSSAITAACIRAISHLEEELGKKDAKPFVKRIREVAKEQEERAE